MSKQPLKKYQKRILIRAVTRKPALHLSGCILYVFKPPFKKKKKMIWSQQGRLVEEVIYNLHDTHRLVEGPCEAEVIRSDPSLLPPVSIKSLVSHSEISCLLSQTLWRGVKPFSAPPDTEATYQTSSFLLVCISGCSHLPMCGFSVCPLC